MTNPASTAAPAAPDPRKQPPPTYIGTVVRADGVTVERWERVCQQRPKPVSVQFEQRKELVYDLDAADEVDCTPRQRRSDSRDAVAQLRIDNERAGREFQRNTITTAKRLGIWQWVVLVFGLGSIGWGAWVTIRGGAGEYPQTQPNNSARSDRERESGARRAGGGVGGSGVNHCRELLIEWLRTGQIGSMTDDEIAAARRAVEADR